MKKIAAYVLLLLSLGWSVEGWVKSHGLKSLQCFSRGLCIFDVVESDSTSYAFDGSTDAGKNLVSMLLSIKSQSMPFKIYDTGTLLPGTKLRMVDGIGMDVRIGAGTGTSTKVDTITDTDRDRSEE